MHPRRANRALESVSILLGLFVGVLVGRIGDAAEQARPQCVVVTGDSASPLTTLAAREIQRYVYLRTGELLRFARHSADAADAAVDAVVLTTDRSLEPEQYRLRTARENDRTVLTVAGGSDLAVLYGAYHFAEKLGVRFYVHGDVIPDRPISFELPNLDETHSPLFEHRGIQPFHDFTEGPDWWSLDDYKTHISQLPKLRMNWIGFHCYPEGPVGPEPLVWIGLPEDVNDDGTVQFAYPSRWASTSGGSWGYHPAKTSEFAAGASLLFPGDDFGSPATDGYRPLPRDVGESLAVFDDAGRFFGQVFRHAKRLGVATVVGTETPLTIPRAVSERLEAKGLDHDDAAVRRRLYEGIFSRIALAHPLDYYWLWTPEDWTWGDDKPGQYEATLADVRSALAALDSIGRPFRLATCGWVLGPSHDRSRFDKDLPKDVAVACINRQFGFAPVEPGFARVEGRTKWAIPWVEDDPAMIIPQLWAGRMRRDAADAYAYGCAGLMGIHWRTKVLAPNFAALAAAAWDQTGWNPEPGSRSALPDVPTSDIRLGGHAAAFRQPVDKTEEDAVYQTVRYDVDGYVLRIPNGRYRVTLKFCEPHYREAGRRVFGVRIQGKAAIESLDVFAEVGGDTAIDYAFVDVEVDEEALKIDFVKQTEFPLIAGIVVDGLTAASNQIAAEPFVRKINCGGKQWGEYEADLPTPESTVAAVRELPRDLPSDDFYRDWCEAWFGSEVAEPMARLFTRLDGGLPGGPTPRRGVNLPRPSNWIDGPGGIVIDGRPWRQVERDYAFVDQMAALGKKVEGEGNRARFDYWLATMKYLRAIGRLGCLRGELDAAMKQLVSELDEANRREAAGRALAIRVELARAWEEMMTLQLAATDTVGEMGTIANLEQHVRRSAAGDSLRFLDAHDEALADAMGSELPESTQPTNYYRGEPRLIVPTVRPDVDRGEPLELKVIVLDNQRPRHAAIHWRTLGNGPFRSIELTHVGRGVHSAAIPPAQESTIEYYVEATTAGGRTLRWPATAPKLNQSVVVVP